MGAGATLAASESAVMAVSAVVPGPKCSCSLSLSLFAADQRPSIDQSSGISRPFLDPPKRLCQKPRSSWNMLEHLVIPFFVAFLPPSPSWLVELPGDRHPTSWGFSKIDGVGFGANQSRLIPIPLRFPLCGSGIGSWRLSQTGQSDLSRRVKSSQVESSRVLTLW